MQSEPLCASLLQSGSFCYHTITDMSLHCAFIDLLPRACYINDRKQYIIFLLVLKKKAVLWTKNMMLPADFS